MAALIASWLPSVPYPPAREDGYWAPITSTIDWCEENYYATVYSAEIVNSFTNLMFMYLAVRGIYSCMTQGHPRVFLITYYGYLATGLGSFAFHSSLKYPMQLVDELSMIYTTCIMFWATFQHTRPQPFGILFGIFVIALALFITLYYHYLQDPSFHQNAYALLTAIVLLRSMYIMEVNVRPSFRKAREARHKQSGEKALTAAQKKEQQRTDERDTKILWQMWTLVLTGLAIFLGGFAIWNMDNAYCSNLRRWRREIGLPWGIFLEGHGWWHLMTGWGAYAYIVWGIFLRHFLEGRADQYYLDWPHWWNVPTIKRIKSTSSQNGHVKSSKTKRT